MFHLVNLSSTLCFFLSLSLPVRHHFFFPLSQIKLVSLPDQPIVVKYQQNHKFLIQSKAENLKKKESKIEKLFPWKNSYSLSFGCYSTQSLS